ncbi:pyridoxal phosphate-dependent transferase [Piptocephalis cylindrospora]|uniref:acetylornithine transaminase n=1 Tax=Piptocephalis cylindrospora TaxID=1907219 RepID=A0A4P9Y3G6_9FUNG|nr:pyridoxal phosphate-dependent transferase [Piptocephalis cylindrospora]|eukprot:RKP13456.1 pyridoxal phosphate-dependent transferase [Piptocephalis cylindrospora]
MFRAIVSRTLSKAKVDGAIFMPRRVIHRLSSSLPSPPLPSLGPYTSYSKPSHADADGGPVAKKLIEETSPYILNTYAKPSVVFSRGHGAYLWDTAGRKYLDFTAGIAVCALGHADKGVAEVLADQATRVVHISNLFHNEYAGRLAKQLVDTSNAIRPNSFSKVFITNSGTEANEGALKIARKYALGAFPDQAGRKTGIVAFEHGFHGRSMGALSVTATEKYRKPYEPLIPGVQHLPFNELTGLNKHITESTGAVIIEPFQGEGGIVGATPEFLSAVRKRCTEVGAVLIFDEIQCGLGRTGHLWAHHAYGPEVVPDIMTLAKPLANGVPIGGILISERVAQCMGVGDHGTTFGGSPLTCRVALEVFGRIHDPSFLAHVRETGKILKQSLLDATKPYDHLVQEVRGEGLLLGIQMKEADMCNQLVVAARERGLLLVAAGRNAVRIIPPPHNWGWGGGGG